MNPAVLAMRCRSFDRGNRTVRRRPPRMPVQYPASWRGFSKAGGWTESWNFCRVADILAKFLIFLWSSMMTREEITELLTARGVFPTAQRVDVALLILAKPQHLSADQIIAGVRAMGSRVSKATVYNTLNLFCQRGLLRTVDVDPTRQYYDSSIGPHHHFYNVDTGELIDIPLDGVTLNVSAALPPGTEQAGVDIVIRVRDGAKRA